MKRIVYIDDVGEILQSVASDYDQGKVAEIIVLAMDGEGNISIQGSEGIDTIYAMGMLELAKTVILDSAAEYAD